MRYSFVGFFLVPAAFLVANPSDPNVVHGGAQFSVDGNTLNVTTSDKTIIEWNRFSIDHGETTAFLQANAQSSVLNRVMSSDPSRLFGTLQSNGKVYLVNQNGILVGNSGVLQTASFVGSTFDVLNEDFIRGTDLTFQGSSTSHLVNEGKIEALDGDVVLIGQFVKNSGDLNAPNGFCGIGCGEQVLLRTTGEQKLYILAPIQTQTDQEAGIHQQGRIQALSAEIKASGNPFALAVLHEGTIDAIGFRNEDGNVYLVAEKGNLHLNGDIRAKRNNEGGTVHLHADQVVFSENSMIDVNGEHQGGSVFAGKDPAFDANPKAIFTDPNASIAASAMENGDGGSVILWAEELNSFNGTILVRGGPLGGNGGFVDISSPKGLFPSGKVDTLSPKGRTGRLVLDPCDVIIDGMATTVAPAPCPAVSAPCAFMPAIAVDCYDFGANVLAHILNTDLATLLLTTNVEIDAATTGMKVGAGTILVSSPIVWPPAVMAGGPTSLLMTADGSITINNSIQANYSTASTVTVICLSAPVIDITSNGTAIDITAAAGNIGIEASTSLTVDSTNQPIDIKTLAGPIGGNFIVSAGSVTMTAPMTFSASLMAEKTLDLTTTGPLSLTGGGDGGSCRIGSNDGFADLTIAGPITLTSGAVANSFAHIETNGTSSPITIDCPNTITILSQGAGASAEAGIFTNNVGDITVTNCTGLTMTGSGVGNLAKIIALSGGPSGRIVITATGTSTMNSFSRIQSFSAGLPMIPVIDLTFGSLSMLAALGSATINSAQEIRVVGTGDLALTATGSDSQILANNKITVDFAGVVTLNGNGGIASIESTIQGDVIVLAENLTLASNPSLTQITTKIGDINITVANLANLSTSALATAGLQINAGYMGGTGALSLTTGALTAVCGAQSISLSGNGSVDIIGTGGDFNIQANDRQFNLQCLGIGVGEELNFTTQAPGGSLSVSVNNGFSFIAAYTKPATFSLNGDLTLTTTGRGANVIASAFQGGSGDLVVSARNISTTAGAGVPAPLALGLAIISVGSPAFPAGGGPGTLTVTSTGSTGITINGGTADNCMSGLYTFAGSTAQDILVNLTHPSANLSITANAAGGVMNAFAGIGSGAMTTAIAPIFGLNQGGGSVTVQLAGGSVVLSSVSPLNPAEIRANSNASLAGALLVEAGGTIDIGANSRIVNNNAGAGGILTLVTDNLNLAPAIGSGTFMLGAGGTLSTASGQRLFVYTSTYQPANINAQINGSPFIAEAVCVDSDTAQWGIYYQDIPNNPNAKIGLPYTFFYKSCYVPPAVIALETTGTAINDKFVQSISESFRDWSYLWDNPGFAMRTIVIGYDNLERVREWLSPDALSSFDLPSWSYSFYAQTHRDYHLLKLDHRL